MKKEDKWAPYRHRFKKTSNQVVRDERPTLYEEDGKVYVKHYGNVMPANSTEEYFWRQNQDLLRFIGKQGISDYRAAKGDENIDLFADWVLYKTQMEQDERDRKREAEIEEVRDWLGKREDAEEV